MKKHFKNRTISGLLAFLTVCSATSQSNFFSNMTIAASATSYSKCDINRDGKVKDDDYALFTQYYFGQIAFDAEQERLADLNNDGTIDSQDMNIFKDVIRFKKGDINCDGKVNDEDLLLFTQRCSGQRAFTALQEILADVNNDGAVNLSETSTFSHLIWVDEHISESRTITEIMGDDISEEARIREILQNDVPACYCAHDYSAVYTKGLDSNFIIVYNENHVHLRDALATQNGELWVLNYDKYLTTLSQMTGVQYDYIVGAFNTNNNDDPLNKDLKAKNPGARWNEGERNGFHISGHAIVAANICGILTNHFEHGFLHETAHLYAGEGANRNRLFKSEEELYVNLRKDCALHWAGLDADRTLLEEFANSWIKKDYNLPEDCWLETKLVSLADPEYSQYIVDKNAVSAYNKKFAPISTRQYLAYNAYGDNDHKLFSRLAAIFNNASSELTQHPVRFTSNFTPNDCNNWLNLGTINDHWNNVGDDVWEKLTALCVAYPKELEHTKEFLNPDNDVLFDHKENIKNLSNNYYSSCTKKIKYYFSNTNYIAFVTPRVYEWITTKFADNKRSSDNAYYMSGNMIQALNMCDFLNINPDTAVFYNIEYYDAAAGGMNNMPTLMEYYTEKLTPTYSAHSILEDVYDLFTVTYNSNYGSNCADIQIQEKRHNTFALMGADAFKRTGYDFKGWNTKADGTGTSYAAGSNVTWDDDITLYAQWKAQNRTITYKANGGSGADVKQNHGYNQTATLKAANTFTRTGYDFVGWNSKADGTGNSYAAGSNVTWKNNVTLYAQWKEQNRTITYKANGGSGADVKQNHKYNQTATLKAANTFTRTGYDFIGWNSKADGTGTSYAAGSKVTWKDNVTLYAQWKKKNNTTN